MDATLMDTSHNAKLVRGKLRNLESKLPYKFFQYLGHVLGMVSLQVILIFVFFVVIVPIAFLFKRLKKDLLNLKVDRSLSTYRKQNLPTRISSKPF